MLGELVLDDQQFPFKGRSNWDFGKRIWWQDFLQLLSLPSLARNFILTLNIWSTRDSSGSPKFP